MPNVKIYADDSLAAAPVAALRAALPALRDLLCHRFGVGPDACQIALVPVAGLPDQPPVNVELLILPRPDRTPEAVGAIAAAVRDLAASAAGVRVAVRVGQLDPRTYLALK